MNHALSFEDAQRYKVEPYVVAADVYSAAQHMGRGGWTWYTGSAGWMYRAGIEGILGIRRAGGFVMVNPCIPAAWPGFEASLAVDTSYYDIRVDNAGGRGSGVTQVYMDGLALACEDGQVALPLDGSRHSVVITL